MPIIDMGTGSVAMAVTTSGHMSLTFGNFSEIGWYLAFNTQANMGKLNVPFSGTVTLTITVAADFEVEPLPAGVAFAPEWDSGFIDRREFTTDVIQSESGIEQRRMVRSRPYRVVEYLTRAVTPKQASQLYRFLFTQPTTKMAVPFWPHVTTLEAGVSQGATTLTCDTTNRDFAAGRLGLLWRQDGSSEVIQVQSVASGSLTLAVGTAAAWGAGSYVVPCWRGWLTGRDQVAWVGRDAAEARLAFELEVAQQEATPATPGRAPVIWEPMGTGELPSRSGSHGEDHDWLLQTLQSASFNHNRALLRDIPGTRFDWEQNAHSLVEAGAFWDAVYDGVGRLNTWWVPAMSQQIALAQPATASATSVVIEACSYAVQYFPYESRRHLFAFARRDRISHHRVTNAVDNLNGTETLTITPGLPYAMDPADDQVLGFMYYCRLQDDAIEMEWLAPGLGRGSVSFVEIPGETPATA